MNAAFVPGEPPNENTSLRLFMRDRRLDEDAVEKAAAGLRAIAWPEMLVIAFEEIPESSPE